MAASTITSTPLGPDTPLREFFENHYRPKKLRGASYEVIDPFPCAINWLGKFLGRVPKVEDLNFDNVQRLQQYLEERSRGVYTIRRVGRRLGDLWRYAHQLRIATPCRSIPYATGQIRQPRLVEQRGAPRGTFEEYYLTTIRPRLAGKTAGYVGYCDTVVSRFTLFRGVFTSLPELGDRLIDEFRQWLVEIGQTQATATNYCGALRRIVRMIDEKLCRPPMQAWRKRSQSEPPAGSVRHFYLTVYKPLRLIGATDESMEQIELSIDRLNRFAEREVMVSELSDELLAAFMRWLLQSDLAAVSVNSRRGPICAIWRFAKRRGLIGTLPDVPKLRECRPEPDAWSLNELGRVITQCDSRRGMIGDIEESAFLKAIAYLGYYTALRRGTMLRLQPSHLDLKTGLLDVPPQIIKNRRGKRFTIPADALAAMRAIYSAKRKLIFTIPWKHSRPLNRRWDELLKLAGLPIGRRQKFHKLRRTAATMAATKTGIVGAMALLGHSEQYVTERYIDPTKLPGLNISMLLPAPELLAKGQEGGGE
jgi:integrase